MDCDKAEGKEGDTEVVHLILAGIAFQASTLVKKMNEGNGVFGTAS